MAQWYWHIHHDKLLEVATEPIENRIAFIKENKAPTEVPTRLRLLKPARGIERTEAYAKLKEADAKWKEAYAKWKEAYAKWKTDPAVLKLHAEQCPDCPWDGRTIFPERRA